MKAILLFSAMLFSGTIFANDLEYSVCQLGVEGVDDVYLLPCETHLSQQACPTGTWIHWKLDTPASKGMLANAQTALVTGKKIIVRLQGCSNSVDHVYMVRLKN